MIFSIRVYLLKEKDRKSIESPKKEDKKIFHSRDRGLVLSIDKDGKITKFNKECEIISGYSKSEALNKYIFDFLIPKKYLDQWENLFDYSRNNKVVDDFELPLLTKNGHEVMVCWSNFPVKNKKGNVVDISLVGNLIDTLHDAEELKPEHPEYDMKGVTIESPIKHKRIISQDDPYNTIGNIDQINTANEQKDVESEDTYQTDRTHLEKLGIEIRKPKLDTYKDKMAELEKRANILNERESKLAEDKMKIDEQVYNFKKWREKLEYLENMLENKREGLLNQEKTLTNQTKGPSDLSHKEKEDHEFIEGRDVIDKISDCAVIIQRGILKQVNDSFTNLIGYNVDEMINKSLFDFIVPEGFSDIEKYYLDRLKGVDVSVYETVFLTKDNDKISVEVSTKPTIFNGIKAEIAIIKKLENKTGL